MISSRPFRPFRPLGPLRPLGPFSLRAFTLLELLFVVSIIAVMAAISVPNFLGAQVRSKVARTRADMAMVNVALRAYSAQYGVAVPNSHDHLDRLTRFLNPSPSIATSSSSAPIIDPLTGLLIDPNDGSLNPMPGVAMSGEQLVRTQPFLSETGWDLAVLTTPIAWLSRALPVDLFHNNKGQPFHYFNIHDVFRNAASTTTGAPMSGYNLLSVGPDAELNFANPILGPYTLYDPSNGTTSQGDLLLQGY